MYKINDYLVYGKDVCKVHDIEEKKFNNEDYYLLCSKNALASAGVKPSNAL